MSGKRKLKTRERVHEMSLEEQLRELDANEVPGEPVRMKGFADSSKNSHLVQPSAERMAWVQKRAEIEARLRRREAKRMSDPGKDASGNFAPSPHAVVGHVVEEAPKDLGSEIPKDSAFPKRIITQRMIDRYKARGMVTVRQWRAGDRMWRMWRECGRDPVLISNYSPDQVRGTSDPDAKMVGRSQAVADVEECRRLTGVLGFELLEHVLRWDKPASDWAATKRTSARNKEAFGMDLLRNNLDVLAKHFRY